MRTVREQNNILSYSLTTLKVVHIRHIVAIVFCYEQNYAIQSFNVWLKRDKNVRKLSFEWMKSDEQNIVHCSHLKIQLNIIDFFQSRNSFSELAHWCTFGEKNDLGKESSFSQLRTFFVRRKKNRVTLREMWVANGKIGKKLSPTLIKYVHTIGTDNERNVINKLFPG